MTREMIKPDWCRYKGECNWWQTGIIGICNKCPEHRQKVLDDWIKPYIDSINERFKRC